MFYRKIKPDKTFGGKVTFCFIVFYRLIKDDKKAHRFTTTRSAKVQFIITILFTLKQY